MLQTTAVDVTYCAFFENHISLMCCETEGDFDHGISLEKRPDRR